MSVRVIKLGGSLLDLPGLARQLENWLTRQPPLANLLVVGGGAFADAVRRADKTHNLGEATAHALCFDALGTTAALAQHVFDGSRLCGRLAAIDRRACGHLQILNLRQLFADPAARLAQLPANWEVTSDSVAAHLAGLLEAQELVLLKSTLPKLAAAAEPSAESLAAAGLVDHYFSRACPPIDVRIVDLRSAEHQEIRLANAGCHLSAGASDPPLASPGSVRGAR